MFRSVLRALAPVEVLSGVRRVVVGYSGGIDSSVMIHLLGDVAVHLGFEIHLLHVHHGVRGLEADRDAEFCQEQARRLGLPLDVEFLGTKRSDAAEHHLRKERYRALLAAMHRTQSQRIFLAHHQDDQVETVLFRLLTGAGFRGLSGMRAFRPPLVRPMLGIPKQAIEAEAALCGVPYVQDSSNRWAHPKRNFIRRQLLPLLRAQINPRIGDHLSALGDLANSTNGWFDRATEIYFTSWAKEGGFDLSLFSAADPLLRRHWLDRAYKRCHRGGCGLRREQVLLMERFLCHGSPRGSLALPGGCLTKARGAFRLEFTG